MAHFRYGWLDENAAERLLRGESVEPRSRTASASADAVVAGQLAAVFDALATSRAGATEHPGSPGEEAAVLAFRAARDRAGQAVAADLTTAEQAAGRRLGGPLRAGFAMAVAGCALGGVAFAAGAGVLPSFSGGGSPAPSTSSPVQASTGGDHGPWTADPSGRTHVSNGGTHLRGPDGRPHPSDSSSVSAGAQAGAAADGGTANTRTGQETGGDTLAPDEGSSVHELCSDYERQTISAADRAELERAAGGPAAVSQYCDQHGERGTQSENEETGGTPEETAPDSSRSSQQATPEEDGEGDGERSAPSAAGTDDEAAPQDEQSTASDQDPPPSDSTSSTASTEERDTDSGRRGGGSGPAD